MSEFWVTYMRHPNDLAHDISCDRLILDHDEQMQKLKSHVRW